MNVLLVYESMYGNTARVADAIAEGLEHDEVMVTACNVDDAETIDPAAFDLLVVGGPTHVHGMSRAGTRKVATDDAKNEYDDPTLGQGLRAWLDALPACGGVPAAAFDTRLDRSPMLVGEASKGIARQLQRRRYHVLERKSFFVGDDNALAPGQLERAVAWGRALARQFLPVG